MKAIQALALFLGIMVFATQGVLADSCTGLTKTSHPDILITCIRELDARIVEIANRPKGDKGSTDPSVKCEPIEKISDKMVYPAIEVTMNSDQILQGYQVTGGGCEVVSSWEYVKKYHNAPPGQKPPHPAPWGHNPSIIVSQPINNGWRCLSADPPNTPVEHIIRASAVICRNIHK
jgi:hypothetical protein